MKNSKSHHSPAQQKARQVPTPPARGKKGKEERNRQREMARNANLRFTEANPFANLEIDATLPIFKDRETIVNTVNRNQVTIVTAETGSGKSTQIPLMLLKAGYKKITVAVSSRTAAISLANRVASQAGTELGKLIGYETSYEKLVSAETKVIYTTQGLQLMHELHLNQGSESRVLIIDECQEWSSQTEALVAWTNERIKKGWKSKVILMSASADTERLSKYFHAPVIQSDGRTYPVTMHIDDEKFFIDNIVEYVRAGKNVLAFVPGKREIDETISSLTARKLNATMLPMHSDLAMDEQALVYERTSLPKVVVATNVAQTSITIPDIDVVVDTGLERGLVEDEGLTSLILRPISQSDLMQRMGRAGRTKEGVYVYCGENAIHELQEYPTPDIYAEPIDNIVLRLATIDIDPHSLKFFHQPPAKKINSAQKTLRILGALDENNKITELGRVMAMLPVSSQHARMLVEAQKRGVLADVAAIVAIQEFGGLKQPNTPYSAFGIDSGHHCALLAELDVFNHVQKQLHSGSTSPFFGVVKRTFYRILELRTKLYDVLTELYGDVESTGNRQEIMMACAAGYVEHLYIRGENNWYSNPNDPHKRKLDFYSLAFPTKYILGLPKNIQLSRKQDGYEETLYLILHGIGFNDVEKLKQLAPHLVEQLPPEDYYDVTTNEYYRQTITMFGDIKLEEEQVKITNREEQIKTLSDWLARQREAPANDAKLYTVLSETNRALDHLSTTERSDVYLQILKKEFCGHVPNLRKEKSVQNLLAAITAQNNNNKTVCY